MRIGARIETFVGAGAYQHKVFDIGVSPRDRSVAASNELIEAQKRANERLWDEMPQGSGPVVSVIYYQPPRRTKSPGVLRSAWKYLSGK